ncbi:unnamed protein product [Closterium sp. NIES-65]|nr:unnamed protein product [Closterium sp. NIES-65]
MEDYNGCTDVTLTDTGYRPGPYATGLGSQAPTNSGVPTGARRKSSSSSSGGGGGGSQQLGHSHGTAKHRRSKQQHGPAAEHKQQHHDKHSHESSESSGQQRQRRRSALGKSAVFETVKPFTTSMLAEAVDGMLGTVGGSFSKERCAGLGGMRGSGYYVALDFGGYYVALDFGSEQQTFWLQIDTTTPVSWLSCDCTQCSTGFTTGSASPPFDPAASKTNLPLTCADKTCVSMSFISGTAAVGCGMARSLPGDPDACEYAQRYGTTASGGSGVSGSHQSHTPLSPHSLSLLPSNSLPTPSHPSFSPFISLHHPTPCPASPIPPSLLPCPPLHHQLWQLPNGKPIGRLSGARQGVWCGLGRCIQSIVSVLWQTGSLSGVSRAPDGVFGLGRGIQSIVSVAAAQGVWADTFALCLEGDPYAKGTKLGATDASHPPSLLSSPFPPISHPSSSPTAPPPCLPSPYFFPPVVEATKPASIVSVAAAQGVWADSFALCLEGDPYAKGSYVVLGTSLGPTGAQWTTFIEIADSPLYFILIKGVSVAGMLLPISANVSHLESGLSLPRPPLLSLPSPLCFIHIKGVPLYFIHIKGVSVAGTLLPIPPRNFRPPTPTGEGGAVLDSSTTFTELPGDVFHALITAVVETVGGFSFSNKDSASHSLMCYINKDIAS